MKIIITIITTLAVVGLVYMVQLQQRGWQKKIDFMRKCAESGGIYAESQVGFVHNAITCNKEFTN